MIPILEMQMRQAGTTSPRRPSVLDAQRSSHPVTSGRSYRRWRGLTLIDLMVTLAVAGGLIGLAGPAFVGFIAQRSIASAQNEFIGAVNYARSEATRRRTQVSIQSRNAGDEDNEWGLGFCVVVGDPGDCDDALRSFGAFESGTVDGLGGLDGESRIRFDARGTLADAVAGTLELCHTDSNPGRRLLISPIGRVTREEVTCT